MKMMKGVLKGTVAGLLAVAAVGAQAGLISTDGDVSFVTFYGDDGGFGAATSGTSATNVSTTTYSSAPTGTVDLGGGKSIVFTDADGLAPGLYDGDSYGWWPTSGDFIGTDTHTINLDFIGMNVVAVQMVVAVSYDFARVWMGAELGGGGYSQSDPFTHKRIWGTKGIGMYLSANAQGACKTIDKAVIDPQPNWGIAGIVVHESTNSTCVDVPEPGALSLLGAGLVAVGWLQRRRRKALTTV